MVETLFPWWKGIAIWTIFLLLHYSYEAFSNSLFQVIGAKGETLYFHMKMIWLVFAIGLASYILFAFKTPDHFFQVPDWYQDGH